MFNSTHKIDAEKNGQKDKRALYKLMKNDVYSKEMENWRNKIDVKLASNRKD